MNMINEVQNIGLNARNLRASQAEETARAQDLRLRAQSRKLEALFITQMFKAMEKTVPESGLTGARKNNLPSMMFSSVMGDAVAEQGGLGLSEVIYNSLREKENLSALEALESQAPVNGLQLWHNLETWSDE